MPLLRKAWRHRLLVAGFGHEHCICKTHVNYVLFPEGRWVLVERFLKQKVRIPATFSTPSVSQFLPFQSSQQEAGEGHQEGEAVGHPWRSENWICVHVRAPAGPGMSPLSPERPCPLRSADPELSSRSPGSHWVHTPHSPGMSRATPLLARFPANSSVKDFGDSCALLASGKMSEALRGHRGYCRPQH